MCFVCEECRNEMLYLFMSAILQSCVTVEEVREFEGLQCNPRSSSFPIMLHIKATMAICQCNLLLST